MKQNIKTKTKQLKRVCPECYSFLSLVEHKVKRGGVVYNEPRIECLECGYVQHNGKVKRHKTEAVQPMV